MQPFNDMVILISAQRPFDCSSFWPEGLLVDVCIFGSLDVVVFWKGHMQGHRIYVSSQSSIRAGRVLVESDAGGQCLSLIHI